MMSQYYDDNYDRRDRQSLPRSRRRSQDSSQNGHVESSELPPYMTPAMNPSDVRLEYEPQPSYYGPSASNPDFDHSMSIQASRSRPRSLPPSAFDSRSTVSRRGSSRSPSPDRTLDGSQRSLDRSKHALKNTFSTSTSGIGAGVLGAIVGGLAAREASSVASRARDNHHGQRGHSSHDDRTALISTILGAAVGGLGANAIENRIERHRHRDSNDRGPRRELEHTGRGFDGDRDHDSDSDGDWENGSCGHRSRERGLIANRSSNRSSSRSYSRGRSHSHSRSPTRSQHGQSGGSADDYYNSSKNYGAGHDRKRRSVDDLR